MLDLLIKLIITLGLQFGYSDTGQIQMTEGSINTLTNSEIYKNEGSPSVKEIEVISDSNPQSLEDIVVVPNIDPTATN